MSFVETSVLKNSTIMLLYSERDEINLNPDYQRMGGVWTIAKRTLLIDSILNDYDIPKLYFHQLSPELLRTTGHRYAVIDGRQRLESIWSFMDGEFALAADFDYQRDSSIDLSRLTYQDIAKQFPKIRIKFDSFVLPVVTVSIDGDDLDLIEDMFSRLNEAVPLNAAEKRNAVGGDLVNAINAISTSEFFTDRVRFSNSRYRHREAAARFLLVEEQLLDGRAIIDTKKEYLDALARKHHNDNSQHVENLKQTVVDVLTVMSEEFSSKDELLLAQGILIVYYLVFRTAIKDMVVEKITRSKLLAFRKSLSDNREKAAMSYEDASFELLEFDRLSQQGTNDASGIRERYSILCSYLDIVPALEVTKSTDTSSI